MIRIVILPLVTLLAGFFFNNIDTAPQSEAYSFSYPEHLTGTFTGGFEEETCHSCHFDFDLNPDENGGLSVSGLPSSVEESAVYEIEITVEREDLGAAGFQLAARYPDGSQAGSFELEGDKKVMFSESVPDSLQYVQHSAEGVDPAGSSSNSWVVRWQAPESVRDSVKFHIAANAANGDRSEFGDWIFTEIAVVAP